MAPPEEPESPFEPPRGPGSTPPPRRPGADAGAVARAFDREAQERARAFFASLEASMPSTWVTWAVLTVNVAVFVGLVLAGVDAMNPSPQDLLRFGADWAPRTRAGQWWRLLTATFLHVGLLHLLVNMYCLKVLGPLAERLLGHAGFLVTYLGAGIAGSLASNAFGTHAVSVGASGSIFGLFGVLLAFTFAAPKDEVPTEARRRLRNVTVQNLAINLVVGLSIPRINNWAHLGGLVGGFLCGFPLARAPHARSASNRARRVALVTVGAVVATVACAWWLRVDDVEGVRERAAATESRALQSFERAVKEALAHRLPARGLAGVIDAEVVPAYRTVESEAGALQRVADGSKEQRDAIRRLAREAANYWSAVANQLRAAARLEDANMFLWKGEYVRALRAGGSPPPLPPSSFDELRKVLPRPQHFFGDGEDGG